MSEQTTTTQKVSSIEFWKAKGLEFPGTWKRQNVNDPNNIIEIKMKVGIVSAISKTKAGFQYPVIELSLDEFSRLRDSLFTLEDQCDWLNAVLRRASIDAFTDSFDDESGEFSIEEWQSNIVDITAAGGKLQSYKDQLESISTTMSQICLCDDRNSELFGFGETVDGTVEGQKTERAVALEKRMIELSNSTIPIKAKIAKIQERYDKASIRRAETKAKKVEEAEARQEEMSKKK